MRHTFVLESPSARFRLISSSLTLLALPLEQTRINPWGPALEKVYVFVGEEA